jgi:hypothetical protein
VRRRTGPKAWRAAEVADDEAVRRAVVRGRNADSVLVSSEKSQMLSVNRPRVGVDGRKSRFVTTASAPVSGWWNTEPN